VTGRLAQAQVTAQQRLRAITVRGVAAIWHGLPGHDRENVDEWLSKVLPLVDAAQRQSAAITDAYISRALEQLAIGINVDQVIGAAVRNGTPPETVYQRPFVTTWAAIGNGTELAAAIAAGDARARMTAAADVQLTQRATLDALQAADARIRGYRRVADAGACPFCLKVNGAYVKQATAMGLHPYCGCTLEPQLDDVEPTPLPAGVAVHDHGELGALLGDPAQHFSDLQH
jgi:hypothetical protein